MRFWGPFCCTYYVGCWCLQHCLLFKPNGLNAESMASGPLLKPGPLGIGQGHPVWPIKVTPCVSVRSEASLSLLWRDFICWSRKHPTVLVGRVTYPTGLHKQNNVTIHLASLVPTVLCWPLGISQKSCIALLLQHRTTQAHGPPRLGLTLPHRLPDRRQQGLYQVFLKTTPSLKSQGHFQQQQLAPASFLLLSWVLLWLQSPSYEVSWQPPRRPSIQHQTWPSLSRRRFASRPGKALYLEDRKTKRH